MPGQVYPPAAALAGMVVVSRMALDELRSHRAEMPAYLTAIVNDALRVLDPVDLPDSAYATAALLLGARPIKNGFGSI